MPAFSIISCPLTPGIRPNARCHTRNDFKSWDPWTASPQLPRLGCRAGSFYLCTHICQGLKEWVNEERVCRRGDAYHLRSMLRKGSTVRNSTCCEPKLPCLRRTRRSSVCEFPWWCAILVVSVMVDSSIIDGIIRIATCTHVAQLWNCLQDRRGAVSLRTITAMSATAGASVMTTPVSVAGLASILTRPPLRYKYTVAAIGSASRVA